MASPIVLYWAPSDGNEQVIATSQDLLAAGNLVLNSNLQNSPVSTSGPYLYSQVARTVALSSPNDLSLVNFTISGIGSDVDMNGNPTGAFAVTTEIMAGPNNESLDSTKIWKQINSISGDAVANGISAGFGTSGITQYTFMDYNKTAFYATCQMQVLDGAGLTYTVYESLTKPETPNNRGSFDVWPVAIPAFSVAAGMIAATTSQIAQIVSPITIIWAAISDTTDDSAYFTVLQQGTHS